MPRFLKTTGALLAIGLFAAVLTFHSNDSHAEESGLAVGVQGSYTVWPGESGVGGGLVARYTFPISDGMFAGLHASYSFAEGARWHEEDDDDSTIAAEIGYSADFLARLGFDIGGVDAYVAAGLALADATVSEDLPDGATRSSSASYTGFKLALGLDALIAESVEGFVQLEYAHYGEQTFGDIVEDVELAAVGLRAGVLYRF